MLKLVIFASLILVSEASVRDSALKTVQKLVENYSDALVAQVEADLVELQADLQSNYNTTRNKTLHESASLILAYNSKAYTQNCSQQVFWALHGIRKMIDGWFTSCVSIEDISVAFQKFSSIIESKIKKSEEEVCNAISYVSHCSEDDPNLSACLANGTLSFLSVLDRETQLLNANKLKVTSYEQELVQEFQVCSADVRKEVLNAVISSFQEYCS